MRLLGADLAEGLELVDFDLVVTNPPYIPPEERATLSPEVRDFEPPEALFAPPGRVTLLERLLDGLARLPVATPVAVELGSGQAELLPSILDRTGFELVRLVPDYAQIPRVALLCRTAGDI